MPSPVRFSFKPALPDTARPVAENTLSHTTANPVPERASADRALTMLVGLHGLALMVVFPLGPQETRLWHPGVSGVTALAAAFPLAAALAGIIARRMPRLPEDPRLLAIAALLSTLPCALSTGYHSLLIGRVIAGLVAGVSYVAIHRALPVATLPRVSRLAPRIVAFGMPLCLLGAALLDWRAVFVPLLAGQAWVALRAPRMPGPGPFEKTSLRREVAPAALISTGALAMVSGAYLSVLSGFLVFNAGQTEFHIPAALLLGALLGLAVPPIVIKLGARFSPRPLFALTLVASALSLVGLLSLRSPSPGLVAISFIGVFIAANAARHLALARLVIPRLDAIDLPSHQTNNHLAHHLGSGIGALSAGLFIQASPVSGLGGMPQLLILALAATGLALVSGFAAATQANASPAACAAAANNR